MEKLVQFVSQHISDDTTRLILDRGKWPEIDMDMAVNCIESRRKLRGKVQEWYDEPRLVFPFKLSAEQCSSSATGRYKAALAKRISETATEEAKPRIADLTGGLGVDSWFFSQVADEVLYNEMQGGLCKAAKHNFSILGTYNIRISNNMAEPDSIADILSHFHPDIVFMDPARRGEGGKKVFLIEDCQPDVLRLKDGIFGICRHILIKLSPMADITMVAERLGNCCREIHIVASGGECKELLIWMDREWTDSYSINTCELRGDGTDYQYFTFIPSEEREATADIAPKSVSDNGAMEGKWLFEPGKALMKAGAFNLIGKRFGIQKLGRSTHYYIVESEEKVQEMQAYGKLFSILQCSPLDKRTIKATASDYPKAEVTARNIPMDTDTLRKKLGVAPSDDTHIFGLKSDTAGNLLVVTRRTSANY